MEGRHVFEHLTVEENLLTGAYTRKNGHSTTQDLELVYGYFPRLAERRQVRAGYVSGGEQQMVAMGRALMARPRLMLLDEPSMGLAPMLVHEIFEIVSRMNREAGVAVLLAEQNATMALRFAQYGYVMENGRIVLDGDARTIGDNEDIRSEEHTSELQSQSNLVCRLLLEKKKKQNCHNSTQSTQHEQGP